MSNQKGFTLIELVVVIVVLGILAAFAVPRFINIAGDARVSAVNGMAGSLRSAVALARAQYLVDGDTTAVLVDMDGTNVGCNAGTGIPLGTAAGIGTALQSFEGFTPDYTTATAVTFVPTGFTAANCLATYNGTSGAVTVTTTGCGN